jgi:hypothetical protein
MSEPIYLYRVPIGSCKPVEIHKIKVARLSELHYWVKSSDGGENMWERFDESKNLYETYGEAKQARIVTTDQQIYQLYSEINALYKQLEDLKQYKLAYLSDKTPESHLKVVN